MSNEFDAVFGNMTEGTTGDGDNLVLDLGSVDEELPQFQPLPAGVYSCIIENAEFSTSKNGNPMITWVFRVVEEQNEGRLLFYHTVLNKEAGLARLKRLLLRVCPDIDLATFKPKAFCEEGVALGRPCRVKIRIRQYQGKPANDITDVLPPDDGMRFMEV